MAITITQQPYSPTPLGQQLIVTATSTNVTEQGFKYKVVVNGSTVYIPPNPDSVLIVDLSKFAQLSLNEFYNGASIHAIDVCDADDSSLSLDVDLYEAWEVAGILTDDPDTLGPEELTVVVWTATFQPEDGYKPSLSRFTCDALGKRLLSDRTSTTHLWQYASFYGFPDDGNKIFIPVRETDWGVMNFIGLGSDSVKVTLIQSNGTPVSYTHTGLDLFSVLGVYPANLNINIMGFPKPSDYPNWRCVTVQIVSGSDPKSALYVLYNVALNDPQSCAYDTIRIAWVGSGGSWEYFYFTKKNEESIEVERKRYQQVLGTYGTSFSQNGMQRGLTEVGNITKRFLTITSDWISEGEFTFLKGLYVSKQVHWIQDDGSFIPMLVEDNQYTEQRIRDGKCKNVTIKLGYANNLWT